MSKIRRKYWKWFGNVGHYLGDDEELFHLHTVVGSILVATVCHWEPKFGYSTKAVVCEDYDEFNRPIRSRELLTKGYASPDEAQQGHMEVCILAAKRKIPQWPIKRLGRVKVRDLVLWQNGKADFICIGFERLSSDEFIVENYVSRTKNSLVNKGQVVNIDWLLKFGIVKVAKDKMIGGSLYKWQFIDKEYYEKLKRYRKLQKTTKNISRNMISELETTNPIHILRKAEKVIKDNIDFYGSEFDEIL